MPSTPSSPTKVWILLPLPSWRRLDPPPSSAVRRTASPSSVAAPAPLVALGEGGLGQAALTPPSSSAVRRSEPPPSVPVAMGLGLGHLSEGHGSPQPPPPVSLVDPSRVSARGVTREEVVAFGGIPDPASTGRRMSARIQELPEVDDMQQRCAMRAAKLHDAAISTGMSVNISNSLLHFSPEEIINNANQLGVSLGATDSEISNSVNDLLDLEVERALETIRNLAAVKPMNDNEIDALGVRVLDNMCVDLAPSNHESEDDDMPIDNAVVSFAEPGYEDRESGPSKPKRKWKRKIYPDSAVRRSARIRTTKKFHDE